MKKISIIGANGRIGREIVKYIYNEISDKFELEVFLIVSEKETTINQLKAFLLDFENSLFLISSKIKNIAFKITQNYELIKNSDIVIVAASKIPTPEEKLKFKAIDETGRLVNCKVNLDIIHNAGEQIKKFAPNSIVLIITNQVDIMCKFIREILGKDQVVIGIANSIDSARFCFCLFNKLKEKYINTRIKDINAHIVGHHSHNMFLMKDSLKINLKQANNFLMQNEGKAIIKECLKETKEMGSLISKLGRNESQVIPQITGAFLSPARATVEVILAYFGEIKKLESVYNVSITKQNIADIYGLELCSEIAIPISISESRIEPVANYKISNEEKNNFKESQKELEENLSKLAGF